MSLMIMQEITKCVYCSNHPHLTVFNWCLSYSFLTEPLIWEFQLVIQCNCVFIVQAWLVKHNWGYNKGRGEEEGRGNVSCWVYTGAVLHSTLTKQGTKISHSKKFLAQKSFLLGGRVWMGNRVGQGLAPDAAGRISLKGSDNITWSLSMSQ